MEMDEPEPATAFDRLKLVQARQQSAARLATAAEQVASKAREAESKACRAREEAEKNAKRLKAVADALKLSAPAHSGPSSQLMRTSSCPTAGELGKYALSQ